MPDTADQAATQLRQQIEGNAGASWIGPDARRLRFAFDRAGESFPLAYLTVAFDGFASADEARGEMLLFALGHEFNVLGNPVRLRRSPGLATDAGFPQGAVLMWRGEGGTPRFGADADGIWSVQMTYCLLPPFAHVVG